jgi:2-methylisocitrate lyase-like PEP mutase family enzyme
MRPAIPASVSSFRALHESGCFVMPNSWDVGSAIYLQHLGFKALATSSAGFALTLGLPDSVLAIERDEMLAHIAEIASAVSLPVNADFLSGFADDPEQVSDNVKACVATGAAGLSIEDATGDVSAPLYDRNLAVERVRAARQAIDSTGVPIVLTARCEAWLVGVDAPARVAFDRLVAFSEAGADCLFAPGVRDLPTIVALVKAVAPKPLNLLVSTPSPDLTLVSLADTGVRRISVGSALARVAWGAFMQAAKDIARDGTFESLTTAAPLAEFTALFEARRAKSSMG